MELKNQTIRNSKNIFRYNISDEKVKKYIFSWLEYLEIEKGFSQNTLLAYEKDLRKFINFYCWYKINKNIDLSTYITLMFQFGKREICAQSK